MIGDNRGQHIGEYAALIGIVATAFLGMQMYVSNRLARGLVGASHVLIGNAVPDGEGTSESNSLDEVWEEGGPGGVTTTVRSEGDGISHSGFILAEAYGPYIMKTTTFKNSASRSMVVNAILAEEDIALYEDDAKVSTLYYSAEDDELVITMKGKDGTTQKISRKLGNYKVIEGSIKTDGLIITAMLDTDDDLSTTADRRMVMAMPSDLMARGQTIDDLVALHPNVVLSGYDIGKRQEAIEEARTQQKDGKPYDQSLLDALASTENEGYESKLAEGEAALQSIDEKRLGAFRQAGIPENTGVEDGLIMLSSDELESLSASLKQDVEALDAVDRSMSAFDKTHRAFSLKAFNEQVQWSASRGDGLIQAHAEAFGEDRRDARDEASVLTTAGRNMQEESNAEVKARQEQGLPAMEHEDKISALLDGAMGQAVSLGQLPTSSTYQPAFAKNLSEGAAEKLDQAYTLLTQEIGLAETSEMTPQEIQEARRRIKAGFEVSRPAPVTTTPVGEPGAMAHYSGLEERKEAAQAIRDAVKQFEEKTGVALPHGGQMDYLAQRAIAAANDSELDSGKRIERADADLASAGRLLEQDLNEALGIGQATASATEQPGHASLATLQRWSDREQKANMLSGSKPQGVLVDWDGDQLPDVSRTGASGPMVNGQYRGNEQYTSLDWVVADPGDAANLSVNPGDTFGEALVLTIQGQDPALARRVGLPSRSAEPMENDGLSVEESLATGRAPIHYQGIHASKQLSPGSVPAGATLITAPSADETVGNQQQRTGTRGSNPKLPDPPKRSEFTR